MGDILVRHNQAQTDAQASSNLKARHLGFSEESDSLMFKRASGPGDEGPGDPRLFPSTIGQGMGRRYEQTGHGFVEGNAVRWTPSGWVLALATAAPDTLASHMVVRVKDADTFDVARSGAWTVGGTPEGPVYLSATTPGTLQSSAPSGAIAQIIAYGDGTALHLSFESIKSAAPEGAAAGDLGGTYPDPIVRRATGSATRVAPVATDFSQWYGQIYGSALGGRGMDYGRIFIGGVEKFAWAAIDAVGAVRWSADGWKTSVLDIGFITFLGAPDETHILATTVQFCFVGSIGKFAWLVGTSDTGIYFAPHEAATYNANGTIKSTAWSLLHGGILLVEMASAGSTIVIVDRNDVWRSIDGATFTKVYAGSVSVYLGGVATDGYGNWIFNERDTGRLFKSTDDGLTWNLQTVTLDGVVSAGILATGGMTYARGLWVASGADHICYSRDGLAWFSVGPIENAAVYGSATDGVRVILSDASNLHSAKLFEVEIEQMTVSATLVAHDGIAIDGPVYAQELAGASSLRVGPDGRLLASEGLSDLGEPPASDYVLTKSGGKFVWAPNSMLSGVVESSLPELIRDGVAGTVTVPSLRVQAYPGSEFFGQPVRFTTTETTLLVPEGAECFVAFRLVAGSPTVYLTTDRDSLNLSDRIPLYLVTRIGTDIHALGFDTQGAGLPQKAELALLRTTPYRRSTDGGLALSEDGSRHISVTSAVVYAGTTKIDVLAYSSSSNSLVECYHAAGSWVYAKTPSGGVYDNANIDNGTAKVAMGANKFKAVWFFRSIGDDREVFYVNGDAEYNTLDAAQAASVPALPPLLQWHTMLIGRVLVQAGASSGVVQTSFSQTFLATPVTVHNNLSGLQGGLAGEYYHLSASERSQALSAISAVGVTVGGAGTAAGKTINFIQGSNMAIAAVDQGDVVDVTLTAAGGGSGQTIYDAVVTDAAGFIAAMASASVQSIYIYGVGISLTAAVTAGAQKRVYGEVIAFGTGSSLAASSGTVRFRNSRVDFSDNVTISGTSQVYFKKVNVSSGKTLTGAGTSLTYYEQNAGSGAVSTATRSYWDDSSAGQVATNSSDSTQGYLADKIIGGNGVVVDVDASVPTDPKFRVNMPNIGVETFPMNLCTGQVGTFDATYTHATIVASRFKTAVNRMSCLVTQASTGNLRMAIYAYDAANGRPGAKLAETANFDVSTVGIKTAALASSVNLDAGALYYFVISEGSTSAANGCLVGGITTAYNANVPNLAREDGNANLPDPFSSGSQAGSRVWLIAFYA